MKQKLDGSPSFSHVHLQLDPGDVVITEADAMASVDPRIDYKTKTNGGIISAFFKRLLAKESFFINHYKNTDAKPRVITFTQATPGDIKTVKMNGNSIYMQPGSFIARTEGVNIKTRWAGFKSWFMGEGLFRIYAEGSGILWLGGYGHVYEKQIDGEYIIDNNHILAYDPSLKIKVQLSGGLISSFTSGEGFVTRMQGKGTVYMQSRSLNGLASFLRPRV
jgi:uncharacterized protein (TIGR00266 family)